MTFFESLKYRFKNDSALTIATATVIFAGYSFAFEAGYCDQFRIPISLISLQQDSVYAVLCTTFFVIIFVTTLTYLFAFITSKFTTDIRIRHRSFIVSSFSIYCFFVNVVSLHSIKGCSLVLQEGIVIIVSIALSIITLFSSKSWNDYYSAKFIEKFPFFKDKGPLEIGWIYAERGFEIPFLIVFLGIMIFVSGRYTALNERHYIIATADKNDNYLLIRIYGDTVIAARADFPNPKAQDTMTIKVNNCLTIFKIAEQNELRLVFIDPESHHLDVSNLEKGVQCPNNNDQYILRYPRNVNESKNIPSI